MATLNFVKGVVKGRIGQFVGSSWKGIDYIKTYTRPGNPRTAGQVAIRNIFQHCAHIGQALNQNVLRPYTFPKPVKMTAYNRMMQINHELFRDKVWDPSKLKIFAGELQAAPIAMAQYRAADDLLSVNWDYSFGDKSDIAVIVMYYESTDSILYDVGLPREAAPSIIDTKPLGQALDVTKMTVYLAFVQPPADKNNNQGMVSNTTYSVITDAPTP